MKKFFTICSLLMVIVLSAMAEGEKIGYLNSDSVFASLNEVIQIEEKVQALQTGYENEYKHMKVDYNKKVKDYIEKSSTLPESIKLARQSEITEAEKRITLYKQRYTEELNTTRDSLLAPIRTKFEKAMLEVANERGLMMVMDKKMALVFNEAMCLDVTNAVIEKLNMR